MSTDITSTASTYEAIAESGNYKAMNAELVKAFDRSFIKFEIVLACELVRQFDSVMDAFILNITVKDKTQMFNFYQGIGHRFSDPRENKGRKLKAKKINHNTSVNYDNGGVSQYIKVPRLADIMSCLLLDANVEDSFQEWCDCTGYDSDSIKDNKIYEACLETKEKLSTVISSELKENLTILLSQY